MDKKHEFNRSQNDRDSNKNDIIQVLFIQHNPVNKSTTRVCRRTTNIVDYRVSGSSYRSV